MILTQQVWIEKEGRYVDWGPEVFEYFTDKEIADIIIGFDRYEKGDENDI